MADQEHTYMRDDEDGENEEETDENNYKSQKDAVLLAIDVSKTMSALPQASGSKKADKDSPLLAALKCAYHLMQQRIISNPKDMMGILLFGTEQSKFQDEENGRSGMGYPHCYLLTDLDVPAAEDVNAIKTLVEDEDEKEIFKPANETVAMANVFFAANQIFTTKAANFGSRRLFIVTDNDDPHNGDKQAISAAAVRAKDLYDLGVLIELFPITRGASKFDLAKFYDDIIYRDPAAEANHSEVRSSKSGDGLTLLNSLISNINSKQTPKRSLFSNVALEIAPGLSISVNGYNVLQRQAPQRSCYIWLDGDKPQIAVGETTRMAEDTARTVDKTGIEKAYKFGGEYVYFTPSEQKSLRDYGGPVIRILGFKPRSMLPSWASIGKSTFIFPSELDYVGSTRVFAALWQKLLGDDKIGIAWCVTRLNASPRLVALIPSRERSDEDNGTPYLPAGLWLYPLPFADEVRPLGQREGSNGASDGLKDKMRTIVQQLQLPKAMYNPTKYPNPSLQWHYKILQALALEEEVPEHPDDATEPKYKAISKRAGGYIEDWERSLKQEAGLALQTTRLKHEADDDVEERPAKKPKASGGPAKGKLPGSALSDAQIKAAVDSGGIQKMTVAQLKDVLVHRGLAATGKKQELVGRLEEWAEEN